MNYLNTPQGTAMWVRPVCFAASRRAPSQRGEAARRQSATSTVKCSLWTERESRCVRVLSNQSIDNIMREYVCLEEYNYCIYLFLLSVVSAKTCTLKLKIDCGHDTQITLLKF